MTISTMNNLFFLGGSTEAESSSYQKQHFYQRREISK